MLLILTAIFVQPCRLTTYRIWYHLFSFHLLPHYSLIRLISRLTQIQFPKNKEIILLGRCKD